jgi:proline racemase
VRTQRVISVVGCHAEGEIGDVIVGDVLRHESLIGSRFTGTIAGETTIAGRPAILPTIEGRAWITGFHSYCLVTTDPYPEGYHLPDTWGVTGSLTQ